MRTKNIISVLGILGILSLLILLEPGKVLAHCDGMDGPVVKAAQKALETENVNLVLIWVQKDDEAVIKESFQKTLAVRKLNPEAKALADMYFFETLVRIHRAGEGAPYTGLKPAGRDLGPAIPAGDKAIEDGSAKQLLKLLTDAIHNGIAEHFKEVLSKKNYNKDNVEVGREYVKAYVEYIHYVEQIYESTKQPAHGHFPEAGEEGMHKETH